MDELSSSTSIENKHSVEHIIVNYMIYVYGYLINKTKMNESILTIYTDTNNYISNNFNKYPIDVTNINYEKIKKIYSEKQSEHFKKNIQTFEPYNNTKEYGNYTRKKKKYQQKQDSTYVKVNNVTSTNMKPNNTRTNNIKPNNTRPSNMKLKKNIKSNDTRTSNTRPNNMKLKKNINEWIEIKRKK